MQKLQLHFLQFLLAVCSLSLNKHGTNTSIDKDALLTTTENAIQANSIIRNEQWISLRKYVVFNYYFAGCIAQSVPSDYLSLFECQHGDDNEMKEEGSGGNHKNGTSNIVPFTTNPSSGSTLEGTASNFSKYILFMDSVSSSEEDPQFWGIGNTRWTHFSRDIARREELALENESGALAGSGSIKLGNQNNETAHNTLAQSLAISKVQLASKQDELEEMQLQFLQLEKKFCALKLELATERANKG